ncbi:MAG: hypothetical protein WBQ79_17120 [Acidobacteriaceae bacterium]
MVIEQASPFYRRNRTLWQLLLLCLVIYVFSAKGYLQVSDTSFSVQTAEAIVERGQLDIPYGAGGTLTWRDGRSYSKYGIGLPLYYIPIVAVARPLSRMTGLPNPELTWFLISFSNIPFALLTLVFFAKLLRLFGIAEIQVDLLLVGLGLGSLTWPYAVSDCSEAMQMGLLMLAVYSVVRRSYAALIAGGVAYAWLVLVKLIYVVFFPVFAIYLFTQPGGLWHRLKILASFTFPLVVACCFLAWLNVVRFGSPLESGYGSESGQFFPSQLWHTVPQLLGSLNKGLFIFCPLLILGVLGWKDFFERHRAEATLCLALIVENLIWSASWWSWYGGWSWGPRLLVPTIPLWLLPGAFLLQKVSSRRRLYIFAVVTLIAIILQIPGVLVKDQEIHQIKQAMLTPAEQAVAPPDYVAAYRLLKHKLVLHNELYRLSELGVPGERKLNLERYRTFRGLNLWTELSARQFNKPALRWIPVLGLLILLYLVVPIGNAVRADLTQDRLNPGDTH